MNRCSDTLCVCDADNPDPCTECSRPHPRIADPYVMLDHTCEFCGAQSFGFHAHELPNGRITQPMCDDCWAVYQRVNVWPIRRLNDIVKGARSEWATQGT